MAERIEVHVVHWPGGWAVKVGGKLYQKCHHKAGALAMAVAFCREAGLCSLKVHGKDGRIQEERTYPRSSDPCPPAG